MLSLVLAKNTQNLRARPQKMQILEKYTFSKFENTFMRLHKTFLCHVSSFHGAGVCQTLFMDFKKKSTPGHNLVTERKRRRVRLSCFIFTNKILV